MVEIKKWRPKEQGKEGKEVGFLSLLKMNERQIRMGGGVEGDRRVSGEGCLRERETKRYKVRVRVRRIRRDRRRRGGVEGMRENGEERGTKKNED